MSDETMLRISRVLIASIFPLGAHAASAQQGKPPAVNSQPKQAPMTIDTVTLILMIKGAVMALHQANQTGNYSVLRDLGTPLFREQFDQAALAAAFANLRSRKINLGVVMLLAPALGKNPELNKNGELVVVG